MCLILVGLSSDSCGELNEQIVVVGLNLCLVCRAVADGSAAFVASMENYISALRIGERLNGAQNTATGLGSVARVDIDVQRAQTEGAVIARGVSKRLNRLAAMRTNKAAVIFCKAFAVHFLFSRLLLFPFISIPIVIFRSPDAAHKFPRNSA